MNERIRELWRDCVLKHTKDPMNWQTVADEFAELLIQECIYALWTEECRTNAMSHADYERSGNRIHKHFWG